MLFQVLNIVCELFIEVNATVSVEVQSACLQTVISNIILSLIWHIRLVSNVCDIVMPVLIFFSVSDLFGYTEFLFLSLTVGGLKSLSQHAAASRWNRFHVGRQNCQMPI